jgi:uncharacterized protein YeaO (DUF488 family)
MLQVKRAYESLKPEDGWCVLVDRLWPRGVSKAQLGPVTWLKDAAPSAELRRWFQHDAAKWGEFRNRYFAELDRKPEIWRPILVAAQLGTVTLVYGARDNDHNNAVALKQYLETRRPRHTGALARGGSA